MDENSSHTGPGPAFEARARQRANRLWDTVRAAAASHLGDQAADELIAEEGDRQERAAKTRETQRQAKRQSRNASRRGEGHELDDDTRPADRCNRKVRRAKSRRSRKHEAALTREANEASSMLRRSQRDQVRAEEQAMAAAEEAVKRSGIRHHFRPIPKLAWFVAYFMGTTLDKSIALRALHMLSVPKSRIGGVMQAAFRPTGYTPSRDVFRGKRKDQTPFVHDGRELTGKQWEDGYRDEDHPGALRVLQVFAFLWLAKSRTTHRGYTYNVRGFGRGVYAAFCRCGVKAITGHSRGVPGALLALKQAGVIWYRVPTEDPTDPNRTPLAPIDVGPRGYAYNCVWFPNDPEEQELEVFHDRIAELAELPLLARVLASPEDVEAMCGGRPRVKPPPQVAFTDADIPF